MSMKVDWGLLTGDISKLDETMSSDAVTDSALRAGARPIEEQMLSNASTDPQIRSSKLFQSIAIGRTKRVGTTRRKIDIGVHSNATAFYAAWVEFGHGGPRPAPPHHYVIPAFDQRSEEAYENMKDVLANALILKGHV